MLPFSQDHEKLKRIVTDPATFATVLYAVALKQFGTEIHEWEPEMFDLEFRDEFQVDMPSVNQDKLNALILSIVTNRFYHDYFVFTQTCELLSQSEADFETLTPDLLPAEIAWGIVEVRLNDNDDPPFDPEISNYVGVILDQNGFLNPPTPLEFAKLPERYLGSTYGAEIDQMEVQETEHAALIGRYVLERSNELVRQIGGLPWANEDLMESIDGELRKISFHASAVDAPPEQAPLAS